LISSSGRPEPASPDHNSIAILIYRDCCRNQASCAATTSKSAATSATATDNEKIG